MGNPSTPVIPALWEAEAEGPCCGIIHKIHISQTRNYTNISCLE
jgi:hypothetical protein